MPLEQAISPAAYLPEPCRRFEDVTQAEPLRLNPKADRDLLLYGYLRGAPLRQGARLHLAGVGDFDLQASADGGPGCACCWSCEAVTSLNKILLATACRE